MDTSDTIEIKGSLLKMLFWGAGFALLTWLFAHFLFISDDPPEAGSFTQFIFFVALILTGFSVCTTLYRLTRIRETILTISPEGIFDRRSSKAQIPWDIVTEIFPHRYYGHRQVALVVDPGAEDRLHLKSGAEMVRQRYLAKGFNVVFVTSNSLQISHKQLLAACVAYAEANRLGKIGSGQ